MTAAQAIEIPAHRQPDPPVNLQQFNPDHTVCYSQKFHGWNRVLNRERKKIERMKGIEIIEAQTLVCIDKSQHPIPTIILREQWWRKIK